MYENYISTLTKARQRFFAWCSPHDGKDFQEVIGYMKLGIKEKKLFEVAPDGGLMESRGTFGVILALGDKELWEMAGPADGDYTTANSKRSELAGYVASLELILMLLPWLEMHPRDKLHLQTWIDSSGAGRQVSNLLHKKKQKRKYPHDADLISHIQWLATRKISWVRGHQDKKTPYSNLPRNAQLNVKADELATAFGQGKLTKKCPPHNNPDFSLLAK
jgi:ribonuclease HI